MTADIFAATPDCEIVSTRIVPASRDLVFAAWTDPERLKNWWGPAGFTSTGWKGSWQTLREVI